MSHQVCVVFGCSNTSHNTKMIEPKVRFFSFPSTDKKTYLEQKRIAWIRFCRRVNADGSPWTPSRHSKICSVHFVGGKNDQYPHQPEFIPTSQLLNFQNIT